MSKLDSYYWDRRRNAYVLHDFDKLFRNGDGELRFHHYKAAIVVGGGRPVWLYANADFDRLIAIINKARKACLRGPALKSKELGEALREARAKTKARKANARRKRDDRQRRRRDSVGRQP